MTTTVKWEGRRGEKPTAVCPDCSRKISLRKYTIAADGTLSPALACQHDGCTFSAEAKLDGWEDVIWSSTAGHYLFFCPGCDEVHGFNATWDISGDRARPTIRPSLLVHAPGNVTIKRCHSFITDGSIEFLVDCEHELAGKTVPLPTRAQWRFQP